jgi:glycosyltransferase involved in cell wall biosynthesis
MTEPFLSIIIPAHNEEHRLPETLRQVFAFIGAQSYSTEVIVVENGSHDHTLEVAHTFADQHPECLVIHSAERGKGRAVRQGMLVARGQYRIMCDADFSMPVSEIARFIPPNNDTDIVIASREAPGAVRYNEPAYRHLSGRVFNTLIRFMVLPRLQDTQCGFKCFRAAVAEDLFRRQTLMGWSFDVEVLFIAQRRGYRIVELPIPWYFNPESKINVLRDMWRMTLDLLRIRLNGWRGIYDA